jgi:DNA repair exonuclease SbcCD nuclease subunit
MLHRFPHIGDAHIQASHPRNGDRLASLDQIIDAGLATAGLAAWLWPGDVFHQKSTPEDRNAVASRLQRMAAAAPVLICYGNHDAAGDLEIFERLSATFPIIVAARPDVIEFRTATKITAACFALPYPHRAGLVAEGIAHDDLAAAAELQLDPVFIHAAANLHVARALMIGHVNIGGAVSSVGQPQIGRELELSPMLLARLGNIPKAFNHIHRHQEIYGAVYAGSIARMDFGENEPKGFVEWTLDDALICAEATDSAWSWRFVPLETPRQVQIDGRLTREAFTYDIVGDGNPPHDGAALAWAGCDVRVRYRYVRSEVSALDVAKIHAEFAGCRSLKIEGIPELEHQVRAPEIAAAATLEAKVLAYASTLGLAWSDGLAAKLAGLQQRDGEELLAELTRSLTPAAATEALV